MSRIQSRSSWVAMLAVACVLLLALCSLPAPTSASAGSAAAARDMSAMDEEVAAAMAQLNGLFDDAAASAETPFSSDADAEDMPTEDDAVDASSAPAHPLVPGGSWSYGENAYSMVRPEATRSFFVYVPQSYLSSAAPGSNVNASLVLLIHGLTAFAQSFADWTGMKAYAESFGFILVYPQGIIGPRGTAWNAGTCCVTAVDDVGFLSEVFWVVSQSFRVRADSVHVAGFSNGGFMTETLACHWDHLNSAASVSGDTILFPGHDQGLALCDKMYAGQLSMLHIHGDADPIVQWPGNVTNGFPPISSEVGRWASRNGCGSGPVQTMTNGTFTNSVWSNCTGASPNSANPSGGPPDWSALQTVELVTNHGGGHAWPSDPSKGIVTTDYIVRFFDAHTNGGIAPQKSQQ